MNYKLSNCHGSYMHVAMDERLNAMCILLDVQA